MPLTYSIATGIGYALAKLMAGKFTDAKPPVLVLALVFAVKFAIGWRPSAIDEGPTP